MSDSKAEKGIEQAESIALRLMSAVGVTLLAASGVVHEAGFLHEQYVNVFESPNRIVEAQQQKSPVPSNRSTVPWAERSFIAGRQEEIPTDRPEDGKNPSGGSGPPDEPLIATERKSKSNPIRFFARERATNKAEGFFESIWDLRNEPALTLGDFGPSRTMFDLWLESQTGEVEKLDRAAKDNPSLIVQLDPKEQEAFNRILAANRALQFYKQVLIEKLPLTSTSTDKTFE